MLTSNPFDTIKEVLPIDDIVLFYGLKVKTQNKAICPFHKEKTPSFTIYPKNNSWYCFGCSIGGTAIDFVMLMYGLSALDAAKKLDTDFGLELFDYKPTQEETHRLTAQKARQQADKGLTKAFEGYINRAYSLLCDYAHMLRDWEANHATTSIEDIDKPINDLFIEACHRLDYIEYMIDCLIFSDIDEQIRFYGTHREELLNIATRIKLYKDSRKADKSAK